MAAAVISGGERGDAVADAVAVGVGVEVSAVVAAGVGVGDRVAVAAPGVVQLLWGSCPSANRRRCLRRLLREWSRSRWWRR